MNFKEAIRAEHPPGNKPIFEEWFYQNTPDIEVNGRSNLSIFWTSFYVNNNYGNDPVAKQKLQNYIDGVSKLYPNKKFYTVLQYDDGILNDISGLDVKVFGSGGGRIDFPIPLICQPHPFKFDVRRDIFASFAGSMTHPIRKRMMQLYRHKYKMPQYHLKIDQYCELMARTIFSLAPRGYGQSSFRICEALQFGSIPVYISDHWIVPGNVVFNEYGVLVHNDEVRNLDKILKSFSHQQIESKREAGRYYYEKMFSFNGCKQLILDNI